ncbi:MAG: hypothetical protein LBP64_11315 [Tannerella sp.]|nr:hypothetical protein [Tannerella sp.]
MIYQGNQKDIFSLKGKVALGKKFITPFQKGSSTSDHFYHSTNYTPKGTDQIDIVATEAGTTTVTFTPTRNCVDGTGAVIFTAGQQYNVNLAYGQTFALRKYTDGSYENQGTLTGTKITSDKLIAVTISEDCIGGPSGTANASWDVAGDQLVPVDAAGTRFVIVRGKSNFDERLDFVATQGETNITVYYKGGQTRGTSLPLAEGETWNIKIDEISGNNDSVVFVQANKPVLCYQHTAFFGELGGAIIPSMYSISQKQIDFFQVGGSGISNFIFLVFKEGCENDFSFTRGGTPIYPTVNPQSIPFPPTVLSSDWKYAVIDLGINEGMVSVKNTCSAFSLGYLSGTSSGSASYGYLSGFGSMTLPFDTLWICGDNQQIHSDHCSGNDIELKTDVLIADRWTWKRDNNVIFDDTYDGTISANMSGEYTVTVDQDGYKMKDTCWVLSMVFDAKFDLRQPAKPAKVTVPQVFNVRYGEGRRLPDLAGMGHSWHADGGTVVSSDENHIKVIWHTTGLKHLTLHLMADGKGCLDNGTFYNRTCDTTLTYNVLVHEKNLGFFVDQNVPYDREHNGTYWENAFPTLQQALALASQGDYIWVADGEYSPRDSFPSGVDTFEVYTGYYMVDYDSVRVYTGSYVMDWDSVQVFGGFSGFGETAETNLSERDINAYPVVLRGSDNKSPVIEVDGSTVYTHLDPGGSFRGVSSAARWDGVTVRDGRTTSDGAGILFTGDASCTISNSVVKRNSTTESGGGIYVGASATPPLIYGVEISGNTAKYGAGIYNAGSHMMLQNVTVGGNLATLRGGGLYTSGGNPVIRNTIIYGNRADGATPRSVAVGETRATSGYGNDMYVTGGTPYIVHSDVGGSMPGNTWDPDFGTNGGGNTDMNPGYYVPGFTQNGSMTEGDYRLSYMSRKTVDGGYNNYLRIRYPFSVELSRPSPRNTVYGDYLNRDLAGDDRIIYENVDMGAYEHRGEDILPSVVYRVKVPEVEGVVTVPPTGVYYVPAHEDFVLRLTTRENYTLANTALLTGALTQDEQGYMEITEKTDYARTYIFHDIIDHLNIQVTGIAPLGAETVGEVSIWSEPGRLYVQSPKEGGVLRVYTPTGRLYAQCEIRAGKTSVALVPGLYIVATSDGRRQRVIIM